MSTINQPSAYLSLDNLVLNETSSVNQTMDKSGNNNNATEVPANTNSNYLVENSLFGYAYNFSEQANNYLKFDSGNNLNGTFEENKTSFTITAWINVRTQSNHNPIVSVSSQNNTDVQVDFSLNGEGVLEVKLGGQNASIISFPDAPILPGSWYFVALVVNSNTVELQCNSRIETNTSSEHFVATWSSNDVIEVGHFTAENTSFKGVMANVRFYNGVLTHNDLNAIIELDLANDLQIYLPLDEVNGTTFPDSSGNEYNGRIQGSTQSINIVADNRFGSVTQFSGGNVNIALDKPTYQDRGCITSVTVQLWIKTTEASSDMQLVDFNEQSCYSIFLGANENGSGKGYVNWETCDRTGVTDSMKSTVAVNDGQWHFISVEYEAGTGTKSIYIDGVLNQTGEKHLRQPLGKGSDQYNLATIGSAPDYDKPYNGCMAQLSINHSFLSAESIYSAMQKGSTSSAAFSSVYPIGFELIDNEEQNVIFLTDDLNGHSVNLNVTNIASQAMELEGFDTINEDNYQFCFIFRPGTLADDSALNMRLTQSEKWNFLVGRLSDQDESIVLYFNSKYPKTLYQFEKIIFTLENFAASPIGGSRSTRVQLNCQNLTYKGNSTPIINSREITINIENHQGNSTIPLLAGFSGTNQVLIGAQNNLSIRLTNINQQTSLGTEDEGAIYLNVDTQFIITFEGWDENEDSAKNANWDLNSYQKLNSIIVLPNTELSNFENSSNASVWQSTRRNEDNEPLYWKVQPSRDIVLRQGESIVFDLSEILPVAPSGHSHLYINYENVPGYWDGQFMLLLEKSLLLQKNGFVGIGEVDPQLALSIGDKNKGIDFTQNSLDFYNPIANGSTSKTKRMSITNEGGIDVAGVLNLTENEIKKGSISVENGVLNLKTYDGTSVNDSIKIDENGDVGISGILQTNHGGGILEVKNVSLIINSKSEITNKNEISFANGDGDYTAALTSDVIDSTNEVVLSTGLSTDTTPQLKLAADENVQLSLFADEATFLIDGTNNGRLTKRESMLQLKGNKEVGGHSIGKISFFNSGVSHSSNQEAVKIKALSAREDQSDDNASFVIQTRYNGSLSDRFKIESNGNVGIGMNPLTGQMLSVNGDTKMQGSLSVTNDLEYMGKLKPTAKPFIIKRFKNLPYAYSNPTGYYSDDYSAVIVGFGATGGDVAENDSQKVDVEVRMALYNHQWCIEVGFATQSKKHETWSVDVMFIETHLASDERDDLEKSITGGNLNFNSNYNPASNS